MTRTLRLSAVALVVLLAAALSACSDSNTSGTALTVNGTEVSQQTIEDEIDDLVSYAKSAPDSQFYTAVFGEDASEETVTTAFTAQVLQERVVSIIINDEFEERGLEITQEDRDAAEAQFASQLAPAPAADPAADPTAPPTTADPAAGQAVFDSFSEEFQDFEITFNARAAALSEALTAETQENAAVTDEDVQAYYEANQDQFTQNCASHILVEDEATANDLKAQLDAGADFATLAEENSTDTGSATQGGDLGCQAPGTFVPEFEAAIDDATIGEVTEPVQTEFGYHLILVSSKGVQSLEEVQDQIRSQLETPADDPLNAFLADALGNAEVEVNRRYGSWNEETLTVDPPEGPASTATTAVPTVDPAAGTATTLAGG